MPDEMNTDERAQIGALTSVPVPMSPINRLVAYSAATKLRSLGFEWDEASEAWSQPDTSPLQHPARQPLPLLRERAMSESLARGAPLTPATWADFVARLHHDCVGEGVSRHYTADATFLVEKRVWQAVPDDLSDLLRIYNDGYDATVESFFKNLEPEGQAALNEACDGSFLEADGYDKRDALAKLHPDATLYSAQERWEFVCQHFTRDAADAFIKRKGHDYREGLRVYVDATCYSWELNAIKAAILDGRIGLIQKEPQ